MHNIQNQTEYHFDLDSVLYLIKTEYTSHILYKQSQYNLKTLQNKEILCHIKNYNIVYYIFYNRNTLTEIAQNFELRLAGLNYEGFSAQIALNLYRNQKCYWAICQLVQ